MGSPDFSPKLYLQCCELYLNLTLLFSPRGGVSRLQFKAVPTCTVYLFLTLSESNATVLPRGGVSRLQFKALPTVFLFLTLSEPNATVLPRGGVSKMYNKSSRIGRQFVAFLSKFWHPTAATPASQTCKTHTKLKYRNEKGFIHFLNEKDFRS